MSAITKKNAIGAVIAVSTDGMNYEQMPFRGMITIDGIEVATAVNYKNEVLPYAYAFDLEDIFPVKPKTHYPLDIEGLKKLKPSSRIMVKTTIGLVEMEFISVFEGKESVEDYIYRTGKWYPEVTDLIDIVAVLAKSDAGEIRAYREAVLIEEEPVPVPVTPKSQLIGLLTQLNNLINNGHDTAKACRSVANLYGKPDEVKAELAEIRRMVLAFSGVGLGLIVAEGGITVKRPTKSQLLGLLTQLDNLINNGADTAKACRSVADLYGKVDEVKAELTEIRQIVMGYK